MRERTQRGSVKARVLADGRTIVWDVYHRDATGKLVCKRGFGSKAEAVAHLEAVLPEVARGTWSRIKRASVDEVVASFLATRAIKPSSLAAYQALGRKVVAVLGDRIVADLKPADVNRLLAHYNDQSRKTRRNLLLFVKALLGNATSEGYAAEDVSRSPLVQKPRAIHEEDTGEVQIMAPEAIGRLLDASEERARPLFHLLASTGLRLGEALSIRWGDVDLVAGTLQVKRTVYKGQFYAPKSQAAIRTVDLGPGAIAMLSTLPRGAADALVFPGQAGKAQDPASLRRGAWARALRKAGLPHSHPHTLRHTFVSMLLEQGQDLGYIAAQVGHSSVVVTATTYAKLLKPRRRDVASAVEARLRDNTVITSALESADTARHGAALNAQEVGQADTGWNSGNLVEGAKYFKAD